MHAALGKQVKHAEHSCSKRQHCVLASTAATRLPAGSDLSSVKHTWRAMLLACLWREASFFIMFSR
jgi:hypothetical protein